MKEIIKQHLKDIEMILKNKNLNDKQVFKVCNILERTAEKVYSEVE